MVSRAKWTLQYRPPNWYAGTGMYEGVRGRRRPAKGAIDAAGRVERHKRKGGTGWR